MTTKQQEIYINETYNLIEAVQRYVDACNAVEIDPSTGVENAFFEAGVKLNVSEA